MRWDEVLGQLVRTRGLDLVRYATLLTGAESGAEDLVQDAVACSFGRGRAVRDLATAEAHARRAIRRMFLDGRRHDASTGEEPWPRPGTTPPDVPAALLMLGALPRVCVVLRFCDDLTVPAISRELGLPEEAVTGHLADAIGLLEAQLGPLPDAHTIDILSTGPAR